MIIFDLDFDQDQIQSKSDFSCRVKTGMVDVFIISALNCQKDLRKKKKKSSTVSLISLHWEPYAPLCFEWEWVYASSFASRMTVRFGYILPFNDKIKGILKLLIVFNDVQ